MWLESLVQVIIFVLTLCDINAYVSKLIFNLVFGFSTFTLLWYLIQQILSQYLILSFWTIVTDNRAIANLMLMLWTVNVWEKSRIFVGCKTFIYPILRWKLSIYIWLYVDCKNGHTPHTQVNYNNLYFWHVLCHWNLHTNLRDKFPYG